MQLNKETLEEFTKEVLEDEFFTNISERKKSERLIEIGAKWKAERMYSEEEVINALHSVELKDNKDYSKIYTGMKEWFKQFKKK